MRNRRGFSLIELLGVIVLLGVLGTVAVTATNKYLQKSRKQAFLMMSQSIYEAVQNCQTQGKCIKSSYQAKELVDLGYLPDLKNPRASKADCTGRVVIHESGTTEYKKYTYDVSLKCPGMYQDQTKVYTWPDQKLKK